MLAPIEYTRRVRWGNVMIQRSEENARRVRFACGSNGPLLLRRHYGKSKLMASITREGHDHEGPRYIHKVICKYHS